MADLLTRWYRLSERQRLAAFAAPFALLLALLWLSESRSPEEVDSVDTDYLDRVSEYHRLERQRQAAGVREPATSTWRSQVDLTAAYVMAEEAVTERLRSPSTARFPGCANCRGSMTTHQDNQVYRVSGWVDAQNAFGATIRNTWMVEATQTSEDRWRTKVIKFE